MAIGTWRSSCTELRFRYELPVFDKLEDEMIPTLEWTPEGVNFLDQTKLPHEEIYVLAKDYNEVAPLPSRT